MSPSRSLTHLTDTSRDYDRRQDHYDYNYDYDYDDNDCELTEWGRRQLYGLKSPTTGRHRRRASPGKHYFLCLLKTSSASAENPRDAVYE